MGRATQSVSNRIAVVFDFDETLTPEDSFQSLLRSLQVDPNDFEQTHIGPLIESGWEKYLARAYSLTKESQRRQDKITKETLKNVGQSIPLYAGAEQLFNRLQQAIQAIDSNIELEFYLISGGFVDIPKHTAIAKYFKCMWGCEFKYGEETGEIEFMKSQMTHVEKTRYLYYLSKGIDKQNERDLIYNYDSIAPKDLHVPLSQVVYVGDGASDIPCFSVIKQYGGISIGIFKEDNTADEWAHLEDVSRSQRLTNLVPASYEEDSELVRSLLLGVEYMSKQIVLRQMSEGQ